MPAKQKFMNSDQGFLCCHLNDLLLCLCHLLKMCCDAIFIKSVNINIYLYLFAKTQVVIGCGIAQMVKCHFPTTVAQLQFQVRWQICDKVTLGWILSETSVSSVQSHSTNCFTFINNLIIKHYTVLILAGSLSNNLKI